MLERQERNCTVRQRFVFSSRTQKHMSIKTVLRQYSYRQTCDLKLSFWPQTGPQPVVLETVFSIQLSSVRLLIFKHLFVIKQMSEQTGVYSVFDKNVSEPALAKIMHLFLWTLKKSRDFKGGSSSLTFPSSHRNSVKPYLQKKFTLYVQG